jgi:hypothetical protein
VGKPEGKRPLGIYQDIGGWIILRWMDLLGIGWVGVE